MHRPDPTRRENAENVQHESDRFRSCLTDFCASYTDRSDLIWRSSGSDWSVTLVLVLLACCRRLCMGSLYGGPFGPWPTKKFDWVGHSAFSPPKLWLTQDQTVSPPRQYSTELFHTIASLHGVKIMHQNRFSAAGLPWTPLYILFEVKARGQ